MTLKCFYGWLKSERIGKRHTVSSYESPLRRCCAARWLLRQLAPNRIQYIAHFSHTGSHCLCKMQIQFSRAGKEVCADLSKPWNIVRASFNRFLFWDRFGSCSGVDAWWPRRVLPVYCLPEVTLEFIKFSCLLSAESFVYFDSTFFLLWVANSASGLSYLSESQEPQELFLFPYEH